MRKVVVVRNQEEGAGREGLYTAGKYGPVWLRFRSLVYFRRGGWLLAQFEREGENLVDRHSHQAERELVHAPISVGL